MQKLKIFLFTILIVTLSCSLLSCTKGTPDDEIPLEWGTYTQPSLTFSIRYPENWVTKDREELGFLIDYIVDIAKNESDIDENKIPLTIELSSLSYQQNVDAVFNSLTEAEMEEFVWFQKLNGTTITGINQAGDKRLYRIVQRNKRQSFKFIVRDTSDEFLQTFDKMFWSFKVLKTNN